LHRLVDVWATGEAGAALGFAAARAFDELDPLEREADKRLAAQGVTTSRARAKLQRAASERAADLVRLPGDDPKRAQLEADPLLRFVLLDSLADVLCPATKLWNTGWGAQMMREAVSLMGGYGITEDCPGFLGNKWMDAQLEATYEGPEAVQRRQLSITMTNPLFLAQFKAWVAEMRGIASERPGTGACTLATAMGMWLWTLDRLQHSKDADGGRLYQSARQGVTFPLADALCWLLAGRCPNLDALELESRGPKRPRGCRGSSRPGEFYDRPVSRAIRARQRRSVPHLRRVGVRIQPSPCVGRGGIPRLLPARRTGFAGGHYSGHRFL